jgi:hypothetical protein
VTASISSFGLFWRRDDVIWTRDDLNDDDEFEGPFKFLMVGKIGEKKPKLRMCDFRFQQGIYILYDEYGPVYVGLAGRRKNGEALGQRLKEHLTDDHGHTWSRFSWFGFDPVQDTQTENICEVSTSLTTVIEQSTAVSSTIRDTEALIMHIIMPQNNRSSITRFKAGREWAQLQRYEISSYLGYL